MKWLSDPKCTFCHGTGSLSHCSIDPYDGTWHVKKISCCCTRRVAWWWPVLCGLAAAAIVVTSCASNVAAINARNESRIESRLKMLDHMAADEKMRKPVFGINLELATPPSFYVWIDTWRGKPYRILFRYPNEYMDAGAGVAGRPGMDQFPHALQAALKIATKRWRTIYLFHKDFPKRKPIVVNYLRANGTEIFVEVPRKFAPTLSYFILGPMGVGPVRIVSQAVRP